MLKNIGDRTSETPGVYKQLIGAPMGPALAQTLAIGFGCAVEVRAEKLLERLTKPLFKKGSTYLEFCNLFLGSRYIDDKVNFWLEMGVGIVKADPELLLGNLEVMEKDPSFKSGRKNTILVRLRELLGWIYGVSTNQVERRIKAVFRMAWINCNVEGSKLNCEHGSDDSLIALGCVLFLNLSCKL